MDEKYLDMLIQRNKFYILSQDGPSEETALLSKDGTMLIRTHFVASIMETYDEFTNDSFLLKHWKKCGWVVIGEL